MIEEKIEKYLIGGKKVNEEADKMSELKDLVSRSEELRKKIFGGRDFKELEAVCKKAKKLDDAVRGNSDRDEYESVNGKMHKFNQTWNELNPWRYFMD